jgi:glucose/arabinose dehydrogenase
VVPVRTLRSLSILSAVIALASTTPVQAQTIQLSTVITGLTSPVFVGNAGDGRLFIVERAGIIKVLQPGNTAPTVFLDIGSKVTSAGSEQGLLGLAFHARYQSNGRFFVFYTHTGDSALIVAEYHAAPPSSNTADTTETVLLAIPHSTNTNHNGGMLAFGTDGYLYIGVGDGGGANDGPNNAQNKDVLLGKILRIDIDASGVPYASPSSNPFFGVVDGRDEIFAYGMRNPWRFSFDTPSNTQWVADVGQGAREEVDTPITNGGNYGWRVFEGTACTKNDRALCSNRGDYILPIFDYAHSGGRCSIIGGYVYRGSQGAVPAGTYVYGDYCSGEIFAWDGSAQTVLLKTALNISSFGEDQQGELYVVGLGGTVSRIARGCTFALSATSATSGPAGGPGSVTVTADGDCTWTATSNASWIKITTVTAGSVSYDVEPYVGPSKTRTGTLTIAGQTFTIKQAK